MKSPPSRWSSRRFTPFRLIIGLSLLLLLCGCVWTGVRKKTQSTSVVNYLYPDQINPLAPTSIPVLRLPLRVGVAFVPTGSGPGSGPNRTYVGRTDQAMSELNKSALLERVAAEFKGRDYIQSIEIIPSTYLRAGGGFPNLDQIRSILGIDVIALVSYDQVQFTDNNFLSLTYWTIVGAYVFHGNQNDTQTLLEAAVYDIPSRHLLFRAPGGSEVKAGAAGVYVDQRLRADSARGFTDATGELIVNLKAQLEDFRVRVKQSPEMVKIEHRPGYTGGGSFGGAFAGGIALLVLARGVAGRFRRPA